MLSLIITALFTEVHDVGSLYHLFYKFFNNTFMVTLTLILRNFAVCLKYRFLKVNLKLIEGQVKYIKTYLSLLEATEHFNKLFEWELFILAIRNVTWTISIAQIFIYGVKTNRLIIGNIILNCIRGSLGWIMLFLVSLSCSDLSKEANKILLIKNVKTFPFGATEIKKINVLKKLIQDKVEINAAGFFRIDKSGLFALTGVVMAYIIVLIQLNKIDF
nr:uncharacterized protein LOC111426496 [Onthophagus taurus]